MIHDYCIFKTLLKDRMIYFSISDTILLGIKQPMNKTLLYIYCDILACISIYNSFYQPIKDVSVDLTFS